MNRAARMARLSILSNTLLILLKLAVGILSGAVSIISEAIHSLMDLAAAVMAFFSIRVAQRPADAGHPYGHEKVENVSGVVEAILVFVAAALIVVGAVKKLVRREPIQHLELGVAVMLVSGIVNTVVSRILYRVAHQEQSVALEADALHLKTDVYASVGVAGGLLVIVLLTRVLSIPWAVYLDPVVAIVIAILILFESWKMLKKAFGPLLDTSISAGELAAVEASVARHPETALHAVRTRRAGGKKHIDFHLTVPAGMSVRESHDLCDAIEQELEARLSNTSVLIHIEPREGDAPGR
ncbi:MAG TPA: cation diffusion facilitator family transporter [Spirochaetia bacterium]|nr:cation diffusion facilitator family transporter [Spirochaetia bacterium]